jgi:hypothetical protein
MNYEIIENPPANAADYVMVPPTDNRDEFVRALIQLLKEETFNVSTDVIPVEWGVAVEKAYKAINSYKMMVARAPDNFGEPGTAKEGFGRFYFERQSKK